MGAASYVTNSQEGFKYRQVVDVPSVMSSTSPLSPKHLQWSGMLEDVHTQDVRPWWRSRPGHSFCHQTIASIARAQRRPWRSRANCISEGDSLCELPSWRVRFPFYHLCQPTEDSTWTTAQLASWDSLQGGNWISALEARMRLPGEERGFGRGMFVVDANRELSISRQQQVELRERSLGGRWLQKWCGRG